MIGAWVRKIRVLGAVGVWLGAALVFLTGVAAQGGMRILQEIFESSKVVDEMESPTVGEYEMESGELIPRTTWNGGDTFYVRRHLCIWKVVTTGYVKHTLLDSAQLELPATSIAGQLYLTAKAFDARGRLKDPPWCDAYEVAVTVPSSAVSPGPITYKSAFYFYLNKQQPLVIVTLKPIALNHSDHASAAGTGGNRAPAVQTE